MVSAILDHMVFLGFCLILFEVFSKLITLIFNIIQIPFAVVSRTAVYIVLVFRTYFLSLFSAVCVWVAVQNSLSPIPFLIVLACVLFGEIIAPYKNNEDEPDIQKYLALSAILSVVLFLLLYFSGMFPLIQVPLFFFSAASWVLNLPVVGAFLNFILPFLSFVTCIWVVINAVILAFAFISALVEKTARVNQ
nr:hypothetical protein [uncultured Agathobaculum sp.]